MKHELFTSRLLKREISYYVIPPATRTESVNILYVQDGNDYIELGAFQETYQSLVNKYPDFANWMIVLIHPGTSEERWQSYHRKGKDFQSYLDFMYEELIPTIEKELTIDKRAVLGDSLAANISLNLAARRPAMWSHILLQSAAITRDDILVVETIKGPIDWHVHQTVGLYEDEFISPITNEQLFIYTRNKELRKVLREKGVTLQFVEEEESHLWVYWKRILPEALCSMLL